MTKAVSLGELLHEEALFGLTGVRKVGVPRGRLFPWNLPLRHTSSSLNAARPFTNKVEKGWKKYTDPMVGGARSITLYDACTPSYWVGEWENEGVRRHYIVCRAREYVCVGTTVFIHVQ